MADQQFDPTKVVLTVGTFVMKQFAADSMVTISYDEDRNTKHIGVDGYGRWTASKNRSGTITITLADYSASNKVLNDLEKLDQPFPVNCVDKSSDGAGFFADSCKVQTMPDFERGRETTEMTWVLGFIAGETNHAGAKQI